MRQAELEIDVSDALGLGIHVRVSASVVLPEPADLGDDRPIVCVALPSSSYARGYYTCALPGAGDVTQAQASFHAARGWIVLAFDWPGSGGGSAIDPEALDYRTLARACHAAQEDILLRLANGVLLSGYPPVGNPFVIGLGAALGGALVIYQQARLRSFDALAVLGFSAIHSNPATPPGGEPVMAAWFARDAPLAECAAPLNAAEMAARPPRSGHEAWDALAWGYHYDDVPDAVVEADLAHYARIAQGAAAAPSLSGQVPVASPWYASRTPERAARSTLTPGIVATEAACVAVPVLVAVGERDIVPDPMAEPRAYLSAPVMEVFVCPRMGHVHNMAGTRALLWERIDMFARQCLEADADADAAHGG